MLRRSDCVGEAGSQAKCLKDFDFLRTKPRLSSYHLFVRLSYGLWPLLFYHRVLRLKIEPKADCYTSSASHDMAEA